MAKTATTRYDVAEHLRTREKMAACLEACLEEASGDAAFIACKYWLVRESFELVAAYEYGMSCRLGTAGR